MRNKTQERVEELARERAVTRDRSGARRGGHRDRQEDDGRDDRDLPVTGQEPGSRRRRRDPTAASATAGYAAQRSSARRRWLPAGGSGYLNEVRLAALASDVALPSLVSQERRCRVPLLPHGRRRAARRRAESLLVAVLSRRAAHDAGRVQAVDPRPSGLVQQLHGRLLGLRPDRRPDRRQAAFRHPHPQDRRPSRSSATGSWPSPAHLARLEARDSRPSANRSPKSPRRSPVPASCSAQADTSRKRS